MKGNFCFRVTVVKRLYPHQSGQLRWDPHNVARAGGNALDGNMFFQRQACDFVFQLSRTVPDLDFFWKALVWKQVRVRPVKLRRENMLSVGRSIDSGKDRRFAHGSSAATYGVSEQQLRSCVIVEKIFIVRVLQQVFKGRCRSLFAVTLLDDWTVRNFAFPRRISASGRYGLHQESVPVGHPLQRIADDSADFHAWNGACACGRRLADPEFNSVLRGVGEGEALAVRRPMDFPDIRVARQLNCELLAI